MSRDEWVWIIIGLIAATAIAVSISAVLIRMQQPSEQQPSAPTFIWQHRDGMRA